MKIKLIEWVDSRGGRSGWEPVCESDIRVSQCRTCGYVIEETDEYISVAGHIELDAEGNIYAMWGEMCIPKAAITKLIRME